MEGPRTLQQRETATAEEAVGYCDDQAGCHSSFGLFAILTMANGSPATDAIEALKVAG